MVSILCSILQPLRSSLECRYVFNRLFHLIQFTIMKPKHIKYSIGAALIIVVTIIACEKQLDKTNHSYPTLDTYFRNNDELLKGTNAIYSIFHAGSLVGREWFFVHDLRSDDVSAGGSQLEVPRAQILNGNASPDNKVLGDVWNGLYTVIHRAN